MTERDFRERMRALNEKEIEIANQRDDLQRQYLEEYPIQINDKCVDRDGKVCWVSNIRFNGPHSLSPYFLVNYPKQNGERSRVAICVLGGLTKKNKKINIK